MVIIPPLKLRLPNSRTSSERAALTGPGLSAGSPGSRAAIGPGLPEERGKGGHAAAERASGVATALAGGSLAPSGTRPASRSPLLIGHPGKLRPRPARGRSPRPGASLPLVGRETPPRSGHAGGGAGG